MSEELMVNFSEMTVDELIKFKAVLEQKYELLCEQRAKDLAELSKDDFDPYTFSGERKIAKIMKKYQADDDGFSFLMEELLRELEQRQVSLEELEMEEANKQSEKLSDEEFIYQELEKNKKFKQRK